MTTVMKIAPNGDGAIPLPPKATVPLFYKYSSLATHEHLARLRVIIQDHELYLPNLDQLNDPADGRPRLAPLSEEQIDRESTRLNSSHDQISYAVFCLKKK